MLVTQVGNTGNSAEPQSKSSPKMPSRASGSLGKFYPSTAVDVPCSASGSSLSGSRNPSLLFNERGNPSPQHARGQARPLPGALRKTSLGVQATATAAGGAQASPSLEAVEAVEAALLKRLQEVRSMRTEILLADRREGPDRANLANKLKGIFEGQAAAPRVLARRVVSFTVAEELESVLGLDKINKEVLGPNRSMDPSHDYQGPTHAHAKTFPLAGSTWPSHSRSGTRLRGRQAHSRSSASPRNGSVAYTSDFQRRAPDQDPSYRRGAPRKPSPADASDLLRSALHRSSLLVPAYPQNLSKSSKNSSNGVRSTRAPSRLGRSSLDPVSVQDANVSPSNAAMDPAKRHCEETSAARKAFNSQAPSRSMPFNGSASGTPGSGGSAGPTSRRVSKQQSVKLASQGSDMAQCVSHVLHVSSISQLQTVSYTAKGSSITRGSSRVAPAPGTTIPQGPLEAPGSGRDPKPASRSPLGRLLKALSACFPFAKGGGAGRKEGKARPLLGRRTLTVVYPAGA